jgi:cysteinyl-tRNA synthetase
MYGEVIVNMAIQIYNSMTGKKEPFETIEPGKVRFYACGPTVYNYFHLGNARMFVVFDTVRRYLEYRGYEVRYVQNFTDVDDKIIQRANEIGKDVRAVADYYIQAYFEDADKLGVRRATVHPRVTECMPDIIAFIEDLIRSGHAYEVNGDVYFDTSSFKDYGKLSHQSVDELRAGFRIEVNDEKRDPTDFALWKKAKPNEEYWESPWGPGRPGWHIECSVMNKKFLGEQIDIHAGGRDLIFPHHENEIAQSEAHSGKPFARYWMHNGTLNINGEKMSKSLGNFIMTRDLLQRRPAHIVRLFLLSAHYRHPLNFTEEAVDHVEQGYERMERCLRNIEHRIDAIHALPDLLKENELQGASDDSVRNDIDDMKAAFIEAMDDDFNTADAIAAIFEGVRKANTYLNEQHVTLQGLSLWKEAILELLDVLGVQVAPETANADGLDEAAIEALIEERSRARKNRDFARADEIRDELAKQNIVIEDTPQGTRWYRA